MLSEKRITTESLRAVLGTINICHHYVNSEEWGHTNGALRLGMSAL